MSQKKLKLGKLKIPVVSDDEANECDYLVCAPWGPSPFMIVCLHSTHVPLRLSVMYRWHAPRKPKRICMLCAATTLAQET